MKQLFLSLSALFVFSSIILGCSHTSGSQILDKERGWIQISKNGRINVYYCDASRNWPTCKEPEYQRLAAE